VTTFTTQTPERASPMLFTGERMVPGRVPVGLFREHEARYQCAARYVKDKVVLDIACGTGLGTAFLLESGAKKCLGMDIDLEAVRYARKEYEGCTFAVSDAATLCLPDQAVDVVVSFETVEHIPNPHKFLAECRRVLRPGGVLVCSTPNHRVYRWYGSNPFHRREFDSEEFLAELSQRFTGLMVYSQLPVMLPAFVAKRVGLAVLDRIGVLGFAKAHLRYGSHRISKARKFCANPEESPENIGAYEKSRLFQPVYIVAVARKCVDSSLQQSSEH